MRLKSYFAQSIGEAIESARLELGPEAMLLNSRKAAPDQNHLGHFEVVFGVAGSTASQKKPQAPTERPVMSKQSSSRRIFPELIAPEPVVPEPYEVEAPVRVQATSTGMKRIFPDLIAAASKAIPEEAEIPAAVEAIDTKRWFDQPVYAESAEIEEDFEELESAPATKPLFEKVTAPAAAKAAAAAVSQPLVAVSQPTVVSEPTPSAVNEPTPVAFKQPIPVVEPAVALAKRTEVVASEDLAFELSELRKQLQAVSQSLAEGLAARAAAPRSSVEEMLMARLVGFDFSEDFSKELIGSAAQSKMSELASVLRNGSSNANSNSAAPSSRSILAQLKSRFTVEPEVGKPGASRRVVVFVGPPGAGKTTTIVKLAVQLGLEQELPIHLLSLDTFRVAGAEQLNAFGRILGVGFTALHTPEALAEALEEHRDKKLVLIDTPGYAAADEEEMENTAAFFRNHPEAEVQLVLPATARTSTLRKFVRRFASFQPSKLLYTRLDEVDTFGPVIENTVATGLPISFLADGQSIPQDLHEATKDRLVEGLFATARAAAFSAA